MSRTVRFHRALLGAALIIVISAAVAWLEPAYIGADTSRRLLGALLGAVVVVYANAIPKFLVARACGAPSAKDQATRRFAGWSMVLGGLGYMLARLLAPIGSAALLGGGVLAAFLLATLVSCLRLNARASGGG